jgi:hypothetical protein
MVGDNPETMTNRVLIADLIAGARLPAMYPFAEFVEAGGLMAYSFDLVELNKRAANDIAAILRAQILAISPIIKPPSSNCPSISRRRKRSVFPYQQRSSPALTR